MVLEQMNVALQWLRGERPGLQLLAGDFNQTLEGRVVGSHAGRAALDALLLRHELIACTRGQTEPSWPAARWITYASGGHVRADPVVAPRCLRLEYE